MKEKIVLVDSKGSPIGVADKLDSHHTSTPLHFAFSCYIFNSDNKLLVTKRASVKKVWPGVWTNSVCGHPAPKEDIVDAIQRRLKYELGMTATNFECILPEYTYKTPPFNGVIEHEFCPVFVAFSDDIPKPNSLEVDDYTWMSWKEFVENTKNDTSDKYSWWCKDQVKNLKKSRISSYFDL